MLWRKILNFIGKDTSGQNESKKLIVTLRIIILSVMLYFIANMLLYGVAFRDLVVASFYGVLLVVFLGMFAMTYRLPTMHVLVCFNIGTILWVTAIVHYFGWNIGVQHFLMVLLVLCFFSRYGHYAGKILLAVCLGIFRIILFFLYHSATPVWPLPAGPENTLQILNTVIIFWCISVVAFIFSNDGQELEGKLIEYNNQLQKQANTDTLTGLYNRRKAMELLDDIVKHPDGNNTFCVCIGDIDFFKKVNDNYGHDFGDEVLKKIAGIFKSEMQGQNFAARWGGEEFLLVFLNCNGDEACVKVEDIRKKIKAAKVSRGEDEVNVTMTFGLAEYSFNHGLEATLKEADEKLYIGKEKGRNIVIF